MSYHGSVYCSWCCTKGHNKRGCSERKEYIRKNPDGYEARKQQNEERRRELRGPRKCSYCDTSGHNRKTCRPLKSDRQFIVAHYKKRRAVIANKMAEVGLGVGALIQTRDRHNGNAIAIVTGFEWKDLNGALMNDVFDSFHVNMLIQRFDEERVRWYSMTMRFEDSSSTEPYDSRPFDLIASRLSPETARRSFPANWVDGTHYDENRFFEKGQHRHYFFTENNPQDG